MLHPTTRWAYQTDRQLSTSDGTPPGTEMVVNLSIDDRVVGRELWRVVP